MSLSRVREGPGRCSNTQGAGTEPLPSSPVSRLFCARREHWLLTRNTVATLFMLLHLIRVNAPFQNQGVLVCLCLNKKHPKKDSISEGNHTKTVQAEKNSPGPRSPKANPAFPGRWQSGGQGGPCSPSKQANATQTHTCASPVSSSRLPVSSPPRNTSHGLFILISSP